MHAKSLTSKIMLADFYEGVCAKGLDPKIAATWTADVFLESLITVTWQSLDDGTRSALIDREDLEKENSLKVPDMVEPVNLFAQGKVSDRVAVEVIRIILDGNEEKTPSRIIEEKGLFKAEDHLVTKAVAEAIAENAAAVQDYLGGAEKSLNFLVWNIGHEERKGTADAKTARELIVKELKG